MALTLFNRLDRLPNSLLAVIYNGVSERKISKFSDHSTAVKRTEAALVAKGWDFIHRPDATPGLEIELVEAEVAAAARAKIDTKTITLLQPENPKQRGSASHARYGLYRTGLTVGDYIRAAMATGVSRRKAVRDIDWDRKHGYIEVK